MSTEKKIPETDKKEMAPFFKVAVSPSKTAATVAVAPVMNSDKTSKSDATTASSTIDKSTETVKPNDTEMFLVLARAENKKRGSSAEVSAKDQTDGDEANAAADVELPKNVGKSSMDAVDTSMADAEPPKNVEKDPTQAVDTYNETLQAEATDTSDASAQVVPAESVDPPVDDAANTKPIAELSTESSSTPKLDTKEVMRAKDAEPDEATVHAATKQDDTENANMEDETRTPHPDDTNDTMSKDTAEEVPKETGAVAVAMLKMDTGETETGTVGSSDIFTLPEVSKDDDNKGAVLPPKPDAEEAEPVVQSDEISSSEKDELHEPPNIDSQPKKRTAFKRVLGGGAFPSGLRKRKKVAAKTILLGNTSASIAARSQDESKTQEKSKEEKKARTEQKSTVRDLPFAGVAAKVKGRTKGAKKSNDKAVAKSRIEQKTSQKKRKHEKEAKSTVKKKGKAARAEPSVLEKYSGSGSKPAAAEVWSGPPDDKLEGGWPEGWVKKKIERSGGATKGRLDPYWYSPLTAKKFRSMTEVRRFLALLGETSGDENAAWNLFKNKK